MSLNNYIFEYSKDWRNAVDFPTVETREVKVRADMQLLFDEMKDAFNRFVVGLSASVIPFSPTEEINAYDIQEAIVNVQAQIAGAVVGSIPDRSLAAAKLVEHTLTNDELGDACVDARTISDGAVSGAKIASDAVTAAKIKSGAVGASELATNAVTAAKIKSGAVSAEYSETIALGAWTGSSAPYSCVINVAGITESDSPIIDLVASDTYSTAAAEDEAWSKIYKAVADSGTITFYAKEKPTVALNFKARCIRK